MGSQIQREEEEGQANIWRLIYSFVESMALKCAIDLRLADIINSHGSPMTLSQIAADIGSPTLDSSGLSRLMRFLVHKKVFDEMPPHSVGDESSVYSLNHTSKWLLHDSDLSLAPLALAQTNSITTTPMQFLSQSIIEGGTSCNKAHGIEVWQYISLNPNFGRIFNEGMACTGKITVDAIVRNYEGGFGGIRSLVDVGGGVGAAIGEIVKANPQIQGINFDLPHVVANAPVYDGVIHVGGNMFETIPQADALFLKWIMHDWGDEDCGKILKNCRKAIPEEGGKIIIADIVLKPGGDGTFDDTGNAFDIVMLTCFSGSGGRERTEVEWKKLLDDGGFPSFKIVRIPTLLSIIEAYPSSRGISGLR